MPDKIHLPFRVGDTVKVHYKIIEKETVAGKTKKEKHEEQKERIQIFEGIVIGFSGKSETRTFRVRRIGVGAIGIERIFPIKSPWIKKIVVSKKGDVRRAKLYYLRQKSYKDVSKMGEIVKEIVEKKQTETPKKEEVKTLPANDKKQPVTG